MPTNRTRRARAWQPTIDEHRRLQLVEGPDALLLAGEGYFAAPMVARADQLSDAAYADMLREMRADWSAHGAAIEASLSKDAPPAWAALQFNTDGER